MRLYLWSTIKVVDVVRVCREENIFSHRSRIEYLLICVSFGLRELKIRLLTSLSLESIDNIERSHGLAFGVFSICDSITNDALEESLQNTACLFVDH